MENKLFAPLGITAMGTAEHVKTKRLQPEQSFERKFKAAHTVHSYQWMDTSDCCKTGLYDYRRIPPMDCFGRRAPIV